METCKIANMYDLSETIAAELFEGKTYPWEVLAEIGDFIKKLGPTLDPEIFEQRGEDIWIAKSVTIAPTATLNGPLIIDEGTEVRPGAFIRGKAIIGKNCVARNVMAFQPPLVITEQNINDVLNALDLVLEKTK